MFNPSVIEDVDKQSSVSDHAISNPALQRVIQMVATKGRCRPVATTSLATAIGWSDRTVRYYLLKAEQLGLLHRPNGPKSGWSTTQRGAQ